MPVGTVGRGANPGLWADMGHGAMVTRAELESALRCSDAGLSYKFGANEKGASGALGVTIRFPRT